MAVSQQKIKKNIEKKFNYFYTIVIKKVILSMSFDSKKYGDRIHVGTCKVS